MKIKEQVVMGLCGLALFAGMATANAQVVVRIGPPAPVVERPGPPPREGFVWVGGYHRWDGHGYVWTPGRWQGRPVRMRFGHLAAGIVAGADMSG